HETEVASWIAPLEVVHPASDDGVDDHLHDFCDGDVQGPSQLLPYRPKHLGAFLRSGSAQDHLLPRSASLVDPAKGIAEEVEGFSCAEVHGARFLFVDYQV